LSAAPVPDSPILYIGGDVDTVQRRRVDLTGTRCFTAANKVNSRFRKEEVPRLRVLLDSGAFSDSPEERLSPAEALSRQLAWEQKASGFWGAPFHAEALVSYDRLIDETWVAPDSSGGIRRRREKQRWSAKAAEDAVCETVAAAAYLASTRETLVPRRLVLSVQGVTAAQYEECTAGVLSSASPADWIGFGGWCILGRNRKWLPVFWDAMWRVVPMIAEANISRVHLFGCLWSRALAGLLWITDAHGLSLSVDSASPLLAVTWGDLKKSGARRPTWEENCAWWQSHVANLRCHPDYRRPPHPKTEEQLSLWSFPAKEEPMSLRMKPATTSTCLGCGTDRNVGEDRLCPADRKIREMAAAKGNRRKPDRETVLIAADQGTAPPDPETARWLAETAAPNWRLQFGAALHRRKISARGFAREAGVLPETVNKILSGRWQGYIPREVWETANRLELLATPTSPSVPAGRCVVCSGETGEGHVLLCDRCAAEGEATAPSGDSGPAVGCHAARAAAARAAAKPSPNRTETPPSAGRASEPAGLRELPVARIDPDPRNARRTVSGIEELGASMEQHGLLEPILVRREGDRFRLIAGERRWRAARLLGWERIPAIVREGPEDVDRLLSLIENLQRQDLSPMEEARGLVALVDSGMTPTQIARRLGKKLPTISNSLRLLKLPAEVQEMADRGEIPGATARALLPFAADETRCVELARTAADPRSCLTSRRLETMWRQEREKARSGAHPVPAGTGAAGPSDPTPAATNGAPLIDEEVRAEWAAAEEQRREKQRAADRGFRRRQKEWAAEAEELETAIRAFWSSCPVEQDTRLAALIAVSALVSVPGAVLAPVLRAWGREHLTEVLSGWDETAALEALLEMSPTAIWKLTGAALLARDLDDCRAGQIPKRARWYLGRWKEEEQA